MDRYEIGTWFKKMKMFLTSPAFGNALIFLVFLSFSALFWLVISLDETQESTIAINVQLEDVPEDVEITSPISQPVKVVIRDRGMVFFHYFRHRNEPLSIPFAQCANSLWEGKATFSTGGIQKMVQNALLTSSKLQRLTPDSLSFWFSRGETRQVPVKVIGKVKVQDEYYLRSVSAQPATVTVHAPQQVLDTLTAVYTYPVVMTGLTKNSTQTVQLRSVEGATLEQNEVDVTAMVDVYMENTITVPILTSNFPADKVLRIFPSNEATVTYTVGYANNKKITADSFVILLTYEQILKLQQQGKTRIPLSLREVPDLVTNVRIEPQEVDYLIETIDDDE